MKKMPRIYGVSEKRLASLMDAEEILIELVTNGIITLEELKNLKERHTMDPNQLYLEFPNYHED